MKRLIIGMILFVFALSLISFAEATGNQLVVTKVDAKVGSKSSKNLADGATISREAAPADSVEFTVEVKSNFSNSNDPDIEDITIEATIEGIDDGDDLVEESSEFDLRPGRDKRQTLKFQLPLEIDEGSYDVNFVIEGRDENGTNHLKNYRLVLTVDKERNDVRINKKLLSPTQISCTRRGVQLTAGVINIGSDDEEAATLSVTSPELGISFKDTFNIDTGAFDDSVKFVKTYIFAVPEDTQPGAYMLNIKATYDDNAKSVEDSVVLAVNECAKATTTTTTSTSTSSTSSTTQPQPPEDREEDGGEFVDLITPATTVLAPATTVPPVEKTGLFSGKAAVGLLIGAEVIGALIVLGVIIRFARK